MRMKSMFAAIACLMFGQVITDKAPLTVSVYYESYCPGCIDYINHQVTPSFRRFNDSVRIDLVPYGNTERRLVHGRWQFRCQHGPKECDANKLHACAIRQACGESGTVTCDVIGMAVVICYLDCVTGRADQMKSNLECSELCGYFSSDIKVCVILEGDQLMGLYGNRTDAVTDMKWSPWITVDGVYSSGAQKDLQKEICRLRPELCTSQDTPPEVVMI